MKAQGLQVWAEMHPFCLYASQVAAHVHVGTFTIGQNWMGRATTLHHTSGCARNQKKTDVFFFLQSISLIFLSSHIF